MIYQLLKMRLIVADFLSASVPSFVQWNEPINNQLKQPINHELKQTNIASVVASDWLKNCSFSGWLRMLQEVF